MSLSLSLLAYGKGYFTHGSLLLYHFTLSVNTQCQHWMRRILAIKQCRRKPFGPVTLLPVLGW